MRQLERRRVRKLLDAFRQRKIKLTEFENKFLWNINNFQNKNENPLSEKQEKILTDLWEKWGKDV